METKIKSKGSCGKILHIGDEAVNLYGRILCPDCDSKAHHLFMAVYSSGKLKKETYCGYIPQIGE